MKNLILVISLLLVLSCDKQLALNERILSDYLTLNEALELGDIVACAGGRENGLLGTASEPTDVFFYPVPGATDFRYFEAENVADSADFSKYFEKNLADEPIFNGYLWKFNNTPFFGERMGVVTYKTPGKIHFCTPIRQKTNNKPTEVNPDLAEVIESGVTPSFSWNDGLVDESVIYFQVISDSDNNLISGTYTIEKEFTFYDLSNVVFNYKFTMMGVSEDNWVNLLIEKDFSTH